MVEDGFGGFLVLALLIGAVVAFVAWRAKKEKDAVPPKKYPPANIRNQVDDNR